MTDIWDKQPYESVISFHHFQMFFLTQPQPRTLARAYRHYLASKNKPKEKIKIARPSTSWINWSRAVDIDGVKLKDGHTWVERADAYDNAQFLLKETDSDDEEKSLLKQNELSDATKQLELWKTLFQAFSIYMDDRKVKSSDSGKVFDPTILISKARELTKFREDIATFQRRALGLPSTIKSVEATKEKKKPSIEWDEPFSDDAEIGVGKDEMQ